MSTFELRPAPISDQRFPCGAVTDGELCRRRARFRLTPTCVESRENWPTAQVCALHLVNAVRVASKRCRGHFYGDVVSVRPLG